MPASQGEILGKLPFSFARLADFLYLCTPKGITY